MHNDLIQGIIFDAKPVIRFRDPLTRREKAFEAVKKITQLTLKKQSGKRSRPTFATNRMPVVTPGSTNPGNTVTRSTSVKIVLR